MWPSGLLRKNPVLLWKSLRKHSLYSPKCMCGVPVVTACSVFAVVNAIIVGLMALGCVALMIFQGVWFGSHWIDNSNQLFALIVMSLITAACYFGTAIAAVFAFLLFFGIRKRRASFLKAYLVYSIIVEIALILSTFIYIGMKSQGQYNRREVASFAIYGTIAVCICVLYGYIVQLVYIAYIVLKNAYTNNADVQTLCLEVNGEVQQSTIPSYY